MPSGADPGVSGGDAEPEGGRGGGRETAGSWEFLPQHDQLPDPGGTVQRARQGHGAEEKQ